MQNSRIAHNRITPLHPRAYGIVENFMRNLNKILRIANMQQRHWMNNKIPKIPTINHEIDNKVHQKLEAHDKNMKDQIKKYFDN